MPYGGDAEISAADTAARFVQASSLRLADPSQLVAAHALAASRIGPGIASQQDLARVQRLTRAAVLVHLSDGRVDGVLGLLRLSPTGHIALLAGRLDAARPDASWLAAPSAPAAAVYAAGIAATSRTGARAVVSGVARLRDACAELPFYARPVTVDGRRVLVERLACEPLMGTNLYWSAAATPREAAA